MIFKILARFVILLLFHHSIIDHPLLCLLLFFMLTNIFFCYIASYTSNVYFESMYFTMIKAEYKLINICIPSKDYTFFILNYKKEDCECSFVRTWENSILHYRIRRRSSIIKAFIDNSLGASVYLLVSGCC